MPLWAVIPPLQVVLTSACSVASLGRFTSHYLPGCPGLRPGILAAHLFGWGIPSTQLEGHVTVHNASSTKSPFGTQEDMSLPNNMMHLMTGTAYASLRCPQLGRAPLTDFALTFTWLHDFHDCHLLCWAEAPIKIARMTLTIKLDRNWSSFQLANSAPPLSVTDSAIAPSARMPTTRCATGTLLLRQQH